LTLREYNPGASAERQIRKTFAMPVLRFWNVWRAVLTVALVMSLAPVALAQDPAPPPQPEEQPEQPIFRARVNLVRVDVSVFGRNGEPITDLQPDDFIVRENGVLQKVETVQFVKLNGQMPPDRAESTDIRSLAHAEVEAGREDVRVFVLFLDDYHVDKAPTIMIPLRRTLRAFIEKLGPYDLVAVMDPLTPLTHVEFTRDKNRLLEIVNSFEGRRGELFPVRSAAEEAQQTQRNIWELRGGVTLDALNAIVTKLGGLREGRKSVLFVSQGPPVSLRSVNWPRMEDVVQSANRANVTIHALDPRPLGSAEFGGNMVLRRFADETGGRAIFNTNDHASHLDDVFNDASAYYLVGYTPTRGEIADGKFHKIDVEVKRPRVRVVARRGYWAPSLAEMTAERPAPVNAEVMSALTTLVEPKTGATAEVWVGFSKGDSNTDVLVAWEPTTRLGNTTAARLEVERLRPDGTLVGEVQQIARGESAARASARFAMAPGRALLRFTSYDSDGELLDRWASEVNVPNFDGEPLTLASPRFLLARSPFELRALLNSPEATPAASRRLRKSDRLLVELEAYSSSGAPELAMELLNERGVSLVTIPVAEPVSGHPRVEIPLQSLAPATYVLKVTARTAAATAEQHVPFRIVP
jgi:VWFA-related protein